MNRGDIVRKQQQPSAAAYDRDKFLESMERYSNYVSSWSWLIGGPSSYFVVESEQSSAEPSL